MLMVVVRRRYSRMRLLRVPEPFDHRDFIFEPKIDGFRALAYVNGHRCELVSRNGHVFKSWPQLAEEIAHAVRARSAVLDGEICCLDRDGRSNFRNLLFRREWPHLYAFDLLMLEGEDLCSLPLLERKRRLAGIMPRVECRLLYLDHLHERGSDLFRVACERDLEGIVGKWATGKYRSDQRSTSWLKIKNPEYSQIRDRHELFEPRGRAGRSRPPRRQSRARPGVAVPAC
jgi:bifunctional non-homologous end joining protein LigD